jgi:hypothetical protein
LRVDIGGGHASIRKPYPSAGAAYERCTSGLYMQALVIAHFALSMFSVRKGYVSHGHSFAEFGKAHDANELADLAEALDRRG